jgi:uncharacterized protein YceK
MRGLHPPRARDNLPAVITATSASKHKVTGARRNLLTLLALIAALTSGCGTFMNQRTGDHNVYGGVKRDWRDITAEKVPEGQAIVTSLDLPLSAIGDTLCLPVDLSKHKD